MMSPQNYSRKLMSLVISLLFFMPKAHAQLDSLLRELSSATPDTIELAILNQLAFEYRVVDTDSTFYYAKAAYQQARTIGDEKWISRSLYNIGVGHHIKGEFDSAILYYHKAIPIANSVNDLKGLSNLYNNLGLVDWNTGDFTNALDYFLQSLQIDEKRQDTIGLISSYNNIGLVYRNMGEE